MLFCQKDVKYFLVVLGVKWIVNNDVFNKKPCSLNSSSISICLGMSYRCAIKFKKFQFNGWKMRLFCFFQKSLVSKTSTFCTVAKWFSRVWLGYDFDGLSGFRSYYGGRWATKIDVCLLIKYGYQNSYYNIWRSFAIFWNKKGVGHISV